MQYITGVVEYPFLNRKDNYGKYVVNLTQLSDDAVEKLTDEGVTTIKHSEDRGNYVVLTNKKYPARVFDTKRNELPSEVISSIGNGSVVTVPIKTFETEFKEGKKTKKFVKVSLGTVYLKKLVEYIPEGLDDEGGYVYDGPKVQKDEITEAIEDVNDDLDDDIPF